MHFKFLYMIHSAALENMKTVFSCFSLGQCNTSTHITVEKTGVSLWSYVKNPTKLVLCTLCTVREMIAYQKRPGTI